MITVSFADLKLILPYAVEGNGAWPVMLRGPHGIGKSSIVKQYALEKKLPIVERRISQMTEGDLLGLPFKQNDESTEFFPPTWYMRACKEPVVLFFDELDRGTHEVRQGIFEIGDSRKLSGHDLHPGTKIFAACNSGIKGANYAVAELDPAELDRWIVWDCEPTLKDWLKWGREEGKLHELVVSFISANERHLEPQPHEAMEPNKVYPSRRSWHRLSDVFNNTDVVEKFIVGEQEKIRKFQDKVLKSLQAKIDADEKKDPNKKLTPKELAAKKKQRRRAIGANIFNLCQAYVGYEATITFTEHLANYEFVMKPEDLLNKGDIEKTKSFSISDHTELVDKINNEGWWTKKLTKKQCGNFARYWIESLPPEIAMYCITHIGDGETDNLRKINAVEGFNSRLIELARQEANKSEKEEEEKSK